MPRKKRSPTMVEVAIKRVGFRKAQRVFTFIAAYAIATESLGKERISIDEYADWWKEARSTAFREQQAFRECFPEFASVDEAIALAKANRREPSFLGFSKVEFAQ